MSLPFVLHEVGFYGPWLAAGLCLVGGLIAAVLMRRTPVRERRDRLTAVGIGSLFGVLAAAPAALFLGMFASGWGADPLYAYPVAIALAGVPLFSIVLGAALTGYVLLARRGTGRRALAGAAAGPLVLGAIALGGLGLIELSQSIRIAKDMETENQQVADRSDAFRVHVTRATAQAAADGTIALVHLTAVVEADIAVELQSIPGKWTEPHFRLIPDRGGHPEAALQTDSPAGSPEAWAAGSRTSYSLTFDAAAGGATARGNPGTWLLQVEFTSNGETYRVETTVELLP